MTFRSGSEGFWLIFLLPLAVFLQDENKAYKPILVILLLNSVILALFKVMKQDFQICLPILQKVNIALSITTLVICIKRGGDPYAFFSYIMINYSFPNMYLSLLQMMPKSFTFGEAIVVCQAFFLSFWSAATHMIRETGKVSEFSNTLFTVFFGHLGYLVCLFICRGLLFSVRPWKFSPLDLIFCFWVFGAIGGFFSQVSVQEYWKLVNWFISLAITSARVKMIGFWILLTAAAIAFVFWKNYTSTQANTRDRKYFHILMVMVYVPGILYDFSLIYVCTVAAMCAFLILETCRMLRVNLAGVPVGQIIEDNVQLFRDKQDEGNSLLTPIYLLCGCSLPLWLNMVNPRHSSTIVASAEVASALAGIISIGIGDTFASIGGSKFGKLKWTGSPKTVEGTVFSIVAQMLFVLILWIPELSPFTTSTVFILLISSVINALVEAKTDQIDNLALPLLTYNVMLILQKIYDFHAVHQMLGR